MSERVRHPYRFTPPAVAESPPYLPGDRVRLFASLKGWPIATNMVMVEGILDQKYFYLADWHYFQETGRKLICSELSLFPPGIGDEGGTDSIQEEYPKFLFRTFEGE